MKKFLSLLILLGLTACFKPSEEKYQYFNLYAFCEVADGATLRLGITGDTFTVVEDQTDSKWMHQDIVFIFYDILDRKASDQYDIRIKTYQPVTSRPALAMETGGEAVYGSDAVSFYQDWGFDPAHHSFDMACLYTSLKDSETEHQINLVVDYERSSSDTLYLELRHQGHGESFENEAYAAKDFQVNTAFLHFNLSHDFAALGLTSGTAGKEMVFCLKWYWFPSENGVLIREPGYSEAFATVTLQ